MDLADKLKFAHTNVPSSQQSEKQRTKLSKATKDSTKATTEQLHGVISQIFKDNLFNKITTCVDERMELE